MTPTPVRGGTWHQPFCQIRARIPSLSRRAQVALEAYAPCAACGEITDGSHSYPGAPALCDSCCPICNPELTQISAA